MRNVESIKKALQAAVVALEAHREQRASERAKGPLPVFRLSAFQIPEKIRIDRRRDQQEYRTYEEHRRLRMTAFLAEHQCGDAQ